MIVIGSPVQPDTPIGPVETCAGKSYTYATTSVAHADFYEWTVEPGDAGTISGTGTVGTFEAATDWTGAYTIKVRALNDCGTGEWSDILEANLNSKPTVFNLAGGGEYCEGGEGSELLLDGSEIGVDYEVYLGFFSTGVVLPGTGDTLNFGFFTDEGIYTARGHSAYCIEFMEGQIGISIFPSCITVILTIRNRIAAVAVKPIAR